eukprot:jgi/Chlat1/6258/Chrsp44S05858
MATVRASRAARGGSISPSASFSSSSRVFTVLHPDLAADKPGSATAGDAATRNNDASDDDDRHDRKYSYFSSFFSSSTSAAASVKAVRLRAALYALALLALCGCIAGASALSRGPHRVWADDSDDGSYRNARRVDDGSTVGQNDALAVIYSTKVDIPTNTLANTKASSQVARVEHNKRQEQQQVQTSFANDIARVIGRQNVPPNMKRTAAQLWGGRVSSSSSSLLANQLNFHAHAVNSRLRTSELMASTGAALFDRSEEVFNSELGKEGEVKPVSQQQQLQANPRRSLVTGWGGTEARVSTVLKWADMDNRNTATRASPPDDTSGLLTRDQGNALQKTYATQGQGLVPTKTPLRTLVIGKKPRTIPTTAASSKPKAQAPILVAKAIVVAAESQPGAVSEVAAAVNEDAAKLLGDKAMDIKRRVDHSARLQRLLGDDDDVKVGFKRQKTTESVLLLPSDLTTASAAADKQQEVDIEVEAKEVVEEEVKVVEKDAEERSSSKSSKSKKSRSGKKSKGDNKDTSASCGLLANDDIAVGVMSRVRLNAPKGKKGKKRTDTDEENLASIDAASQARFEALSASWLGRVRNSAIFTKTVGAQPEDYLVLLDKLAALFPGKKWYLMAHDDTYLYVRALLCSLGSLDASGRDTLYAGMTHCCGPNFACRTGNIKGPTGKPGEKVKGSGLGGWINGGAGIAVSGGLLKSMKLSKCARWYSENWGYNVPAADVVMACCVLDAGEGFTSGKPGFQECHCDGSGSGGRGRKGDSPKCSLPSSAPLERRISWHHVDPAAMVRLHAQEIKELGAFGEEHFGRPLQQRLYDQ